MKTIERGIERKHELQVAWRTPLGPMTGRVSAEGVRALRFPPAEALTLEAPGEECVEVEEIQDDCGLQGSRTVPDQNSALEQPGGGWEAEAHHHADRVTEFLIQFFRGLKPCCPPLDMNGASEFDRAVWRVTGEIPPGETRSYGQIAAAIGRPGSARAVGGALGRNPLVLLVPCHRVIASTPGPRALCGFTGGLALKRRLLELEKVAL